MRGKIAHVGEEHGRLHDVGPRRAGRREDGAEIPEDLLRLRDDVALDDLPVTGSSAIWPAVKRKPLATTACEYGPMAAGALSVCTA